MTIKYLCNGETAEVNEAYALRVAEQGQAVILPDEAKAEPEPEKPEAPAKAEKPAEKPAKKGK